MGDDINRAPRHPGCSYQIVWGQTSFSLWPKVMFCRHLPDAHRMRERHLATAPVKKALVFYIEHRLRFFKEPVHSPSSQGVSFDRSQIDQSDLKGKWTWCWSFDLFLPVPGNVDVPPRPPLPGQWAHVDAVTVVYWQLTAVCLLRWTDWGNALFQRVFFIPWPWGSGKD